MKRELKKKKQATRFQHFSLQSLCREFKFFFRLNLTLQLHLSHFYISCAKLAISHFLTSKLPKSSNHSLSTASASVAVFAV